MDRTWIVAYDFTEQARAALAHAARWLSALGGGRLVAVHVVEYSLAAAGADLAVGTGAELMLLQDDAVRAGLERDLARASAPGVTFEARLASGAPAEAIAELAQDLGAECVAVGTHGRRGVERVLLGSVAEQILRLSPCPVLVVKT